MFSQHTINILSFIWTSGHDFVYLGIAGLLVRFHVLKHKKSADECVADHETRLGALEDKHK